MAEYKCGDCFHADLCEESKMLFGFSRDNPAYCGMFLNCADVAPVRHGRWVKSEDDYYELYMIKCSVCREEWCFECDDDAFDLNYHYCPNCGAKMDEEVSE